MLIANPSCTCEGGNWVPGVPVLDVWVDKGAGTYAYRQGRKRFDRANQTEAVEHVHLVVRGTVDEDLENAVRQAVQVDRVLDTRELERALQKRLETAK